LDIVIYFYFTISCLLFYFVRWEWWEYQYE